MCGFFGSQSDPAVTRRLDRIERKLDTMMDQLGVTGSDPQGPNDLLKVEELALKGKTIDAIKRYRQLTGAGLAEAKAFVDQLR